MDLGALMDYCIEWNELHGLTDQEEQKEEKPRVRDATQADIDKLLGR